jgi:uncharacterized coiled-coil DUF342 family protein
MTSETIQTSVEHLYGEIEKLKTSTIEKKNQIRLLRPRIEDSLRHRDELNAEVKRISAEVKELREKRDSLNAKVRELKTKRDELRNEASKKRANLSKLLEQTRQISEQLHGSMSEVLEQIKRLEWYIQTNPLSTKAERNIIAKIGALEANLAKHKGLKSVRDNLLGLKVEVGALRIQAQTTHEQLTAIAEESEKLHTAMHERAKILEEKKKAADEKHSEYLMCSKERYEAVTTLRSSLQRIDELRTQIGETRTSSRVEKAEKLKSKYKESANNKVRTGGKLSFEEFQALMGDSLSDDEDD